MTGDVHGSSALRLVLVWVALVALALLSYLLSRAHLAAADVAIALAIAVVKTVLVALYFMELAYHRFVHALVLVVSGAFVVLLVSLTVADVVTRHTFPKGPLPIQDGLHACTAPGC
jgi:cytochrome c oxidase subunit 4